LAVSIVMAGPVPAIHVLLDDCIVEIVPGRIIAYNQPNLPRARPMFDVVFALNCRSDVLKSLEINEPLQSVAAGKSFDVSRTMFEHASNEIFRHADVKNAIWAICQNINVSACHAQILQDVDGLDKPDHDDLLACGRGIDQSAINRETNAIMRIYGNYTVDVTSRMFLEGRELEFDTPELWCL